MEPQEYPLRHFMEISRSSQAIREVACSVLEHHYNYSHFGSWWTVVRRKGCNFRIVFDGKDNLLVLQRECSTSAADSWEMLGSWSAPHGEDDNWIQEIVFRLTEV